MIGLLSSNKHNRIWNDKGGEFQPLCTPKAKNSPHSDYRTLRGTRDGLRRPKKLKDPQLNSILTWPFTIILITSWFLIFYWNLYSNDKFLFKSFKKSPQSFYSSKYSQNFTQCFDVFWGILSLSQVSMGNWALSIWKLLEFISEVKAAGNVPLWNKTLTFFFSIV